MNQLFKIEKNVPLPTRGTSAGRDAIILQFKTLILQMNPGNSFQFNNPGPALVRDIVTKEFPGLVFKIATVDKGNRIFRFHLVSLAPVKTPLPIPQNGTIQKRHYQKRS